MLLEKSTAFQLHLMNFQKFGKDLLHMAKKINQEAFRQRIKKLNFIENCYTVKMFQSFLLNGVVNI